MPVQYVIDGETVHVATGGRAHVTGRPFALFLHGAGFDHTAWALQSRWLAFRGWNVLSPDLRGHGRSAGAPLTSIRAMADWSARLIEAAGAGTAVVIGHSMGALIALELARTAPSRVSRLLLIGAAGRMTLVAASRRSGAMACMSGRRICPPAKPAPSSDRTAPWA